jgi:hypothetical protein
VLQSMSSHYVFSLKAEDLYRKRDQRSRLFLGKLRYTGANDYTLFDNGMVRSTTDRDDDINRDDSDDDDGRDAKSTKNINKDASGDGDEVSFFRRELAVIHFNTKKRPAPMGTRGSEVCIPKQHFNESESDGVKAEAKGSRTQPQSLQIPFQTIRDAGRQNELHAKKCYVMHEKTSRYLTRHNP